MLVVHHGGLPLDQTWQKGLFEAYAQRATVIYVDPDTHETTPGRVRSRLRKQLRDLPRETGLLRLRLPAALPGGRYLHIARASRWLAMHALLTLLRQERRQPIVLISQRPTLLPTVRGLPADLHVYEVVDDYAGIETQPRHTRRVARAHQRRLRECGLVWATSRTLVDDLRAVRTDTVETSNGVEFADFSRGATAPCPDVFRNIPRPRIGLVGHLNDRVDWRLLEAVAIARPDWQLVLIGPLYQAGDRTRIGVERLRALPNVHRVPEVPHAELPAHMAALDVGLIPYRLISATLRINPLKLYQYLAVGRPVVATPLPAVTEFDDVVACCATAESFLAAIASALVPDPDGRRARTLQQRALLFDWQVIADRHLELLSGRL